MSYQSLANELKINNLPMIARWLKEFRAHKIQSFLRKKYSL
ncbi:MULTISPECIES: hypothetical protein [Peptoniphilus]|nr:hypothetical protein HMPREF9131_0705 [Peptoniphilus sp. oral taxon 836 str. F0141]